VDPLDQTHTLEIRAQKWVAGELVATEEHTLWMRSYFRDELVLMLECAGFHDVDVRGGYSGDEPTADHELLVFIAQA
jgi:hypothetical protein